MSLHGHVVTFLLSVHPCWQAGVHEAQRRGGRSVGARVLGVSFGQGREGRPREDGRLPGEQVHVEKSTRTRGYPDADSQSRRAGWMGPASHAASVTDGLCGLEQTAAHTLGCGAGHVHALCLCTPHACVQDTHVHTLGVSGSFSGTDASVRRSHALVPPLPCSRSPPPRDPTKTSPSHLLSAWQ